VLPSSTPSPAGFQFSPAPASTPSSKPDLFAPKAPAAPSEGFKVPRIQPSAASTTKSDISNAKLTPESSAHKAPSSTKPSSTTTTSPQSLAPPPSQPACTQKDRDRLASDLARIALTRQDGLIRKYIEFTLPDLVKTALNQHRLEVHDAAVGEYSRSFTLYAGTN